MLEEKNRTPLEKNRRLEKTSFKSDIICNKLPWASFAWKKEKNDLVMVNYNKVAKKSLKGQNLAGNKASEFFNKNPLALEIMKNSLKLKKSFSDEIVYQYPGDDRGVELRIHFICLPDDIGQVFVEDLNEARQRIDELQTLTSQLEGFL